MPIASVTVAVSVSMRMAVAVRGVAVTRVRCLCETAQRHDAEANSTERQAERVGVHDWV
jgi:hypothetical protein